MGLLRIAVVPICALTLIFAACGSGGADNDDQVLRVETPEPAATPTTGPPPSPTSEPRHTVMIEPGEDIQEAVDQAPEGTLFELRVGVHRSQSVQPKDDQRFRCEPGAVLDGEDSATAAFYGSASNVAITGCIIERYASPDQQGAIHIGGSGWTVQDNEIRLNRAAGIVGYDRSVIRGNYVHHNRQIGIKVVGGADALVEGNEVAYNNPEFAVDYFWEAGGTKFVSTTNLVVRGNHVHNNNGPGLWTDIDNYNTLYEDNIVESNAHAGIFHEISFAATIRNNVLAGNGWHFSEWFHGAQIQIANSTDVEVYGNVVTVTAGNGITVIQQDRGSYSTRNVHVHSNEVRYLGWGITHDARTGAAADHDGEAFFNANISFEGNQYKANPEWDAWAWGNGPVNWSQFQDYGQENEGIVVP